MALDPFAAAEIGPGRMRNRFSKAATFEGMPVGGLATDRLTEFHRAVAAPGIGMPTLAYLAVSEDGQGARGGVRRTRRSLRAARRALRRLPLNRAQLGVARTLAIYPGIPACLPTCFARAGCGTGDAVPHASAGSASFSKRSVGCEATLRPIAARTTRSCTAGRRISIATRTATTTAPSSIQPVVGLLARASATNDRSRARDRRAPRGWTRRAVADRHHGGVALSADAQLRRFAANTKFVAA